MTNSFDSPRLKGRDVVGLEQTLDQVVEESDRVPRVRTGLRGKIAVRTHRVAWQHGLEDAEAVGQHHQRQVVVALFERPRKIDLFKAVSCTSRSMLVEVIAQLGVIGFTRGVVALSLTQALVAISVLGAFAFNLPLSVPAPMLLGLAAGAVTASMAAAASVAWRTTRVSPLEALRYEQRSSMRRIR